MRVIPGTGRRRSFRVFKEKTVGGNVQNAWSIQSQQRGFCRLVSRKDLCLVKERMYRLRLSFCSWERSEVNAG